MLYMLGVHTLVLVNTNTLYYVFHARDVLLKLKKIYIGVKGFFYRYI